MVIMMRIVVPESGFVVGSWSIFDDGQELPETVSGSSLEGMTESNPVVSVSSDIGEGFFG